MGVLFVEHQSLVARAASSHDGKIVKTEGDGFWLVFPSVTSAALAALAMQSALRLAQPNRGDDRLAMRIVIVLGDVLHQDGVLVGEAVVLAARIEQLTPPDEIYLSPSAWLATNHVEVRTSFVESFALKGFDTPVPVYRVDPTHRTQIFTDQYIMVSDLKGFDAFTAAQGGDGSRARPRPPSGTRQSAALGVHRRKPGCRWRLSLPHLLGGSCGHGGGGPLAGGVDAIPETRGILPAHQHGSA